MMAPHYDSPVVVVDLAAIESRAAQAEAELDRLTTGNPSANWRWHIPANPDRDTDLILSASAADVRLLVAELQLARAEAARIVAEHLTPQEALDLAELVQEHAHPRAWKSLYAKLRALGGK